MTEVQSVADRNRVYSEKRTHHGVRICHVPEKSRVRGFSTKPARGQEESERNARSPRSCRLFHGQVLNELRGIFREELAAVDTDKVVTRYRLEESKPKGSKFSGRSPMPSAEATARTRYRNLESAKPRDRFLSRVRGGYGCYCKLLQCGDKLSTSTTRNTRPCNAQCGQSQRRGLHSRPRSRHGQVDSESHRRSEQPLKRRGPVYGVISGVIRRPSAKGRQQAYSWSGSCSTRRSTSTRRRRIHRRRRRHIDTGHSHKSRPASGRSSSTTLAATGQVATGSSEFQLPEPARQPNRSAPSASIPSLCERASTGWPKMRDKVHASSPLSLSGGSWDVSSSRFIRSCSIEVRVSIVERHACDSPHADAPSSSSSSMLLARSGRKTGPRSKSPGPSSVGGCRPRSLRPERS